MQEKVNDSVFGEMEYKHRWLKEEEIFLFGRNQKVKIVAKAYSGKPITDIQREKYKKFKQEIEMLSNEAEKNIKIYIQDKFDEIKEYWQEAFQPKEQDKLDGIVLPRSIIFNTDGSVVILCDCIWDIEQGIGVQLYPEFKVGVQDMFL